MHARSVFPVFLMKTSHPVLLSRTLVVFSLVIGFVLAAGSALLSTVSTREVAAASIRASHTHDTVLEINQLLSSLVDAETGQRGYMLTRLDRYLEPYTNAVARLEEQLVQLGRHFEHAPAQQAILARISQLVAEKKAELSRTIDLRRTSTPGAALHLVDSGVGLDTMNALRDSIHQLEQNELAELAFNSASVSRRAGFFQRLGLGMLIAACVLGGAGAVLLMRRVHELEAMITVCAWTNRVKFNGKWVSFEDYLRARFNLRFTHGISEEAASKMESAPRKAGHPARVHPSPERSAFAPTV
jgi:CHASE3 domain sensor protein